MIPVVLGNPPASSQKRVILAWCGPVLVGLAFLALTYWTWRKWPDLLIDFGRELYVPWQILNGKILYKDIAYFNGPLSPYLNTLWFRLFGISLISLAFLNLLITAIITFFLYYLVQKFCDKMTGLIFAIIFLIIFAFPHFEIIGNFNYICPYSHEITHGCLLSIIGISLLFRYSSRQQSSLALLIGTILGLIFLTKIEIFFAAFFTIGAGMILLLLSGKLAPRTILIHSILILIAMVVPILLFTTYFALKMPFSQSLKGVCGSLSALFTSNISDTFFYKKMMGVDKPGTNLLRMWGDFFKTLALVAGSAALAIVFEKSSNKKKYLIYLPIIILPLFLLNYRMDNFLLLKGRHLTIIVIAAMLTGLYLYIKNLIDKETSNLIFPFLILSIFSFLFLAKTILRPGLTQYGFILSMPAILLFIVLILKILPGYLQRYGAHKFYLILIIALISVDLMGYLSLSNYIYGIKNYAIGEKDDVFYTYNPEAEVELPKLRPLLPRGAIVSELLKEIRTTMPSDTGFVVLPEGIMINYLLRRPSPIPFINFMPPEMAIFGEGNILKALKEQTPGFIILIDRDVREYGVAPFGTDSRYGKEIMEWVTMHYHAVWEMKKDEVGAKILMKNHEGPMLRHRD